MKTVAFIAFAILLTIMGFDCYGHGGGLDGHGGHVKHVAGPGQGMWHQHQRGNVKIEINHRRNLEPKAFPDKPPYPVRLWQLQDTEGQDVGEPFEAYFDSYNSVR